MNYGEFVKKKAHEHRNHIHKTTSKARHSNRVLSVSKGMGSAQEKRKSKQNFRIILSLNIMSSMHHFSYSPLMLME